ncbi:MAG: glycoside hydrolase family 9 protein, partial [Fibrobacterota bacterium]
AIDLPLGPMRLSTAGSIRFDFLLADRGEYSKSLGLELAELYDTVRQFLPDRKALAATDNGWWDVRDIGTKVPDFANSWSFSGVDTVMSQTAANQLIDYSMGSLPLNTHVVIRRKGVDIWGYAPDGSGPGILAVPHSPDEGGVLPYAPIAAALPVNGDRKPLDSALARPSRVRVNQAGYRLRDVAAGLARVRYFGTATTFSVLKEGATNPARTGTFSALGFQAGTSLTVCEQLSVNWFINPVPTCLIDSDTLRTSIPSGPVQEGVLPADLGAGRWRVVVGTDTSSWFWVTDSVYGWVRDAAVRYFGLARSGDSSWFHGPSHMLDGSLASATGAYKDGWYDGGDHLKEPQTMSMALATLATLASTRPELDADRWGAIHRADQPLDGVPDVLKEARWGATFFMNSWIRNGRTTGDTLGQPGMVTGIGDFGKDHGYWGPPQLQDQITVVGRGGALERIVRRELGANTLGDVAAGLALLSVQWRSRDAAWADDALAAAKSMYAWAKSHRVVVSSPAYNGAGPDKVNANLALAATALLWATRDSTYLRDIVYDKTIGVHGMDIQKLSSFEGGWMVMSNPNLLKGGANADWANRHALALYAFAKLVLLDSMTARSCGVRSEAERQLLLRRTLAGMQSNLEAISGTGTKAFDLPHLDPNTGAISVGAGSQWGELFIQQEWAALGHVAANATELLLYADVARELGDGKGGQELASVAWPVGAAMGLGLRQVDWILGLNTWDISMMAGIGSKNQQNPHHRGANPDGSNTAVDYRYRTPVGAMWGFSPNYQGKIKIAWNDYHSSEPLLMAQVQILSAAYLLSPPAEKPVSGLRGSRLYGSWRMAAHAGAGRILTQVEGLGEAGMAKVELLDASGRRLASGNLVTNSDGGARFLSPALGRGLVVVRVHAAGESRTRAVVVP